MPLAPALVLALVWLALLAAIRFGELAGEETQEIVFLVGMGLLPAFVITDRGCSCRLFRRRAKAPLD